MSRLNFIKTGAIMSLVSMGVLSCAGSKSATPKKNDAAYTLVFEEQFNGNAYNTDYWTTYPPQVGTAPWNRFVVDDADVAEVKDGNLHVRARWNSETNLPETGAVQTKDKFSFKYG